MRASLDSLRTFRELTRLFAQRLDRTGLGRFARVNALFITVLTIVWVLYLRVADGPGATGLAIPVKAARAALWLGALPIAFAAAHQRKLADRRDGIEALALTRGVDTRHIVSARVVAAFGRSALAIAVPAIGAGLLSLACANNVESLVDRFLVLVIVAAFAILAGAVIGSLGALSEIVSPNRGRSLFLALLFVSWGLADLSDRPFVSITGALGLALRVTLRAVGLGAAG